MEIYHQYVRLRKQFGRHPRFVDESAEMLADIRPNEEHAQVSSMQQPCTHLVVLLSACRCLVLWLGS